MEYIIFIYQLVQRAQHHYFHIICIPLSHYTNTEENVLVLIRSVQFPLVSSLICCPSQSIYLSILCCDHSPDSSLWTLKHTISSSRFIMLDTSLVANLRFFFNLCFFNITRCRLYLSLVPEIIVTAMVWSQTRPSKLGGKYYTNKTILKQTTKET